MALRKGQTVQNTADETEILADGPVPHVVETAAADDTPPFEAKEVEQEPQPEPTKPSPSQEVAHTQGAVPVVNKTYKVCQELEDSGFVGTKIGYGTFPMIVLVNEGHFESSEGWDMGEVFECAVQSYRPKYVFKNTRCEKRDEDVIFSYDGVVDANSGRQVAEIKAEWAEKGWGVEVKEYREASAVMIDGDHDGEPVLLSIPQTSRGRHDSLVIRERMKTKQDPNEYITRCSVGEKVTKVDFPFYPWKFERV
jgi:hypothetical protein